MLLPGASFVIIAAAGLVGLALCLAVSVFIGSLALNGAEFLIERTNAWKAHRRGNKDTKRWWFDTRGWAGAFMIGAFIVLVYTMVGPWMSLIEYIGGI
jgi:hypothetical protein